MRLSDLWKHHPDSPNVIAPPPVIFGLGFLIGYACNVWWGWSFGVGPAIVFGWPLLAGGILLAGWAAWQFRRAGTAIPPHRPASALVAEGPYRVTRNPMYMALTIAHVGLAALLDAPAALFVLAAILPLMHWGVVLREEAYLQAKFPEAYGRYRQTTKRYL